MLNKDLGSIHVTSLFTSCSSSFATTEAHKASDPKENIKLSSEMASNNQKTVPLDRRIPKICIFQIHNSVKHKVSSNTSLFRY